MAKHRYHDLAILASSQFAKIWLTDKFGHLVQMEIGKLHTSLLPGRYIVSFGLKAPTYPIELKRTTRLTQSQLEAGPTCVRPIPQLLPE